MQPNHIIHPIQQPINENFALSKNGPTEVQWKGRIFSVSLIDKQANFGQSRKFTPDLESAYGFLVKKIFGSYDNATKIKFENKNGIVSIHLTQRELKQAIKDGCVFVGERTNEKNRKDWLFTARINDYEKQITIIPESLQSSKLKFNLTVDNVSINLNQEIILCPV